MGYPRHDPRLASGDSVQKDVPEDQETQGHPPQGPDTLVVLEFNPASKSKLCLMRHFFAFAVSGSLNSALGRPLTGQRGVSVSSLPMARGKGLHLTLPDGTWLAVVGLSWALWDV